MNRPVWVLLELFQLQLLVLLEFLVLLERLQLLVLLERLQLLHVVPAFLFLLQSMGFLTCADLYRVAAPFWSVNDPGR